MPRRIRIALFGDGNVGRQHENSKTYPLLPEFKVAYHYKEGMKATQCDEIEWRALLASKPTHVFLHYGGNEITSSSDPKTIYQAIEAKIRELWFHGCVVWAAGILPMGKFQDKTLTIQCYDKQRASINQRLKKLLRNNYITMLFKLFYNGHLHPGFNPDHATLSKFGIRKYSRTLRRKLRDKLKDIINARQKKRIQ